MVRDVLVQTVHLRVLGALVSSSTADASSELSRDAEGRLKGLVEIEIFLGLLGASTALTMGLVLRHSATRQSALFRSLVRGSADMIFLTARDGRVRYASPALLTVLGRPPSTMLGRPLDDIIDTRRSDNTVKWFRGTPPPDGPLEPLTVVFIHQDGSFATSSSTPPPVSPTATFAAWSSTRAMSPNGDAPTTNYGPPSPERTRSSKPRPKESSPSMTAAASRVSTERPS